MKTKLKTETKIVAGIEYQLPKVYLLQETGIGTAEFAARTCYDSFNKSENESVKYTEAQILIGNVPDTDRLNDIEHSDLLNDLAWTYFHHSILEHAVLTYAIKGTSRGVLQEHARHRIQAISVQSTRYTMSPIINAFVACMPLCDKETFESILAKLDFLVLENDAKYLEISQIWDKLWLQVNEIGEEEFLKLALSKPNLEKYHTTGFTAKPEELFFELQNGKAKRNVGDNFKWLVTDNWKVDMVVTFNLRSLKNYFTLRDNGAAYWQIQELAKAMKAVTPKKYLDLIVKDK